MILSHIQQPPIVTNYKYFVYIYALFITTDYNFHFPGEPGSAGSTWVLLFQLFQKSTSGDEWNGICMGRMSLLSTSNQCHRLKEHKALTLTSGLASSCLQP